VMSSAVRTIHGHSTIGETADYVLKNAPCEVILVREPLGYPARSLRSADAR
jgi:nucleotide-binding universal stress UspA family protein